MKNLLKEVILKIKSLWNLIISYKSVPRWIKNLRKYDMKLMSKEDEDYNSSYRLVGTGLINHLLIRLSYPLDTRGFRKNSNGDVEVTLGNYEVSTIVTFNVTDGKLYYVTSAKRERAFDYYIKLYSVSFTPPEINYTFRVYVKQWGWDKSDLYRFTVSTSYTFSSEDYERIRNCGK